MGPGGLWVTKTLTKAKDLRRYAWLKHQDESFIHLCIIDKILYRHKGSGRAKTNKLFLLDRIQLDTDRWRNEDKTNKCKIETTMLASLNEIKDLISGSYDSVLDSIPFDIPKTKSLARWIAKTGGVRDVTLPGELRDLIKGDRRRAKGIPPGFLNNKRGRGLDEILDEANNRGWWGRIEDESHLIGILEQEQREAYNL